MRRILLLIVLLSTRVAFAQQTPSPVVSPTFTQPPTASATPSPSRTPTSVPTVPPTAEPTLEGFATGGSGEVLFPEAIRFLVSLSSPTSELARVLLTIDTAAADPVTLELEIDDITQSAAPNALLAYTWELPEDAIPPLFSAVDFIWAIEAIDGETARVDGSVLFADQRVVWTINREAGGDLIVAAAREVPSGLVSALPAVYELLAANTGSTPEVRLLVYGEAVSPGCLVRQAGAVAVGPFSGVEVDCRPEFAEQVYRESGYMVFQHVSGDDLEAQFVGALVRAFYAPLWDNADVPRWFADGLEQLYTPALKTDLLLTAQTAARRSQLFTLAAMNSTPPDDAERAQIWRAQSYGMALYMVEQVGLPGVFSFANRLSSDTPFAELYAQMTGESLDALIASWQGWMFTERAASVYGITAYQPATVTFTPTATLTPTRTATETATSTSSVTPSVTGVLSPTPYPTVTASRTPTLEPPTVTPRPPQRTPTPSPGNPIIALSTPGVQAAVVVALLVVIVVLVYVYIRVGRR